MVVFLSVLKIIGITLLVLLGLILLLILLLLFFPFRYDISGRKNDDTLHFEGKVTWFKYLLKAFAEYDNASGVSYSVKILFFKLLPKTVKKEEATESDSDVKAAEENRVSDELKEKTADASAANVEAPEADKAEEEYKSVYEKLCDLYDYIVSLPDKIKEKTKALVKIKEDAELKKKYIDDKIKLFEDDRFVEALKAVLKELWLLLKKFKPVKGKGILYIGFEDPSNTGMLVAGYSILYPYIGELIELNADFENEVLKGNFYFKGKFTVFMILYSVIRAYLKDDLPYLLEKADM